MSKCVFCGKNPKKCNHRVTIYGYDREGKKKEIVAKNVLCVWGNGFKISKQMIEKHE